ncbi:MAG: DUF533 domain-containing protein [Pseudomonadota bacterium]
MIDTRKLLEQFLGAGNMPGQARNPVDQTGQPRQGNQSPLEGLFPGNGSFAGGAAMGGILGLLLGSKKVRKMTGGLVGYGGAAAIGALAHKAYQNYQQGNQVASAPVANAADLAQVDPRFVPGSTTNDGNFSLSLISAMIGAAKADGHIDAREQTAIFEHVEKLGLDAESKAFVFDALNKPADMATITAAVQGVEQATEMYLVSRLIADGDHPGERMYMEALAHRLNLPKDLVAHLEHQVGA